MNAMVKQANILVVDDEATVREVVRKYLEHEGYCVAEAETGPEALAYLREQRPDLIVLDLMLPGMDGFAITRSVRNANEYAPLKVDNDIPIIILTARTSELDRIAGFELGADDYVIKPFSPRELVARVKAVLRRSASGLAEADEKPLFLPELSIDPRSREVKIRGSIVVLTVKEFDLLWWMARHPHQVFSRAQLAQPDLGLRILRRRKYRDRPYPPPPRKNRGESQRTNLHSDRLGGRLQI